MIDEDSSLFWNYLSRITSLLRNYWFLKIGHAYYDLIATTEENAAF